MAIFGYKLAICRLIFSRLGDVNVKAPRGFRYGAANCEDSRVFEQRGYLKRTE
ncbi:MAG: hypothetical protein ACJAU6_001054 [Alphaproteobacteria bacterium]|jgi:hypothetical protein